MLQPVPCIRGTTCVGDAKCPSRSKPLWGNHIATCSWFLPVENWGLMEVSQQTKSYCKGWCRTGKVKALLEEKGCNHQNSYSPRCSAKLQKQNTSHSWCNSISSEANAPSGVHLVEFHAGIILGSLPPKVVHHILVHQKFIQPAANMCKHVVWRWTEFWRIWMPIWSCHEHDGCHLFVCPGATSAKR